MTKSHVTQPPPEPLTTDELQCVLGVDEVTPDLRPPVVVCQDGAIVGVGRSGCLNKSRLPEASPEGGNNQTPEDGGVEIAPYRQLVWYCWLEMIGLMT